MKKTVSLIACLFALSACGTVPTQSATNTSQESAADLYNQGLFAYEQGHYAQAAKLYEKSCNGDIAESCSKLGSLYALGRGVEQHLPTAIQYLSKACNLGRRESCDLHKKLSEHYNKINN